MSKVQVPAYVVAGITDHITPWQACYQSKNILRGKIDFVLSSSGHIQSIVNPPANPKAGYFLESGAARYRGRLAGGASEHAGSWWDHWAGWYRQHGGGSSGAAFARQHAGIPQVIRPPAATSTEMTKPHVEYIEVDGINCASPRSQGQARHTAAAVQRHRRQSRVVLPLHGSHARKVVIFDAPGMGRSEMSGGRARFRDSQAWLTNCSIDSATAKWTSSGCRGAEHWRNSSHASIRSAPAG